jgi:hypothetical protein
MNETLEQLLIINIIMAAVSVLGVILGLLWFRVWGDPLERDTVLFIVKMFAAIWAFGNVLFFIMR